MNQDGMELMLTLALFYASQTVQRKLSLSVSLLLRMTTLRNNITENFQPERISKSFHALLLDE
jgi:hypothetical protein